MEKGNIKPIDRTSVHKICSGQVVLTLATAVKELVENSIDAGATLIDVRTKEYGSELIEVSDNGNGVKACDFQSLTLKHHTSKIADFSDLPFVSTFGFRGEALSSLCALSDLEITTCSQDCNVGSALIFDHNGTLVKNIPTPRQVGTTVTLKNIFSTFPVRHQEFLKHIRKEFSKMIQLLTAYCLISVNKRITCTNITEKGKKNVVLSTSSSPSYKDNILSIFGDKQTKQLMEIIQHLPSKEVLDEYFLPETAVETSKTFILNGYVSNCTHGDGRSSSDRQFYFINGRPCDLPKVSKLTNEVYHSFNKHQYPFIFMNIVLNEGHADINVTPDKRQIFILEEKVLLALIKTTLLGMYGKQPSQMTITPLNFQPKKKTEFSPSTSSESPNCNEYPDSSLKRKKFDISDSLSDNDDENPLPSLFKRHRMENALNKCVATQDSDLSSVNTSQFESSPVKDNLTKNCSSSVNKTSSDKVVESTGDSKVTTTVDVNLSLTRQLNEDKIIKKLSPKKSGTNMLKEIVDSARRFSKSPKQFSNKDFVPHRKCKNNREKSGVSDKVLNYFERLSNSRPCNQQDLEIQDNTVSQHSDETKCVTNKTSKTYVEVIVEEPVSRIKSYKDINFNMEIFKQQFQVAEDTEKCSYRKFRSKILPTENQNAEEELKREISKEDFSQMEIIGQFNLGFIIARLHDDLFIIDQHATDEKYNFEQLQKETVLETQKLLQPQMLNLTAASEVTFLENLHIFELNGFKFKINEDNPVGEKIQLVSVPVSQNCSFGKEDVDDMIFMMTDNPVRMIRPSRLNDMFASRACRKSVMIGTALTKSMMKKLVLHMGELDQPWNCPHGRPTIRHLFNLRLLKNSE